jgi:GNAT superfamily N-acetyltransferase
VIRALHDLRSRPDLGAQIPAISRASWPPFLLHSNVENWESLLLRFPEFQFVLCEPGNEVIAVGHAVPIPWDGSPEDLPETINGILRRANAALDGGGATHALCALAAMVRPDHRGHGLSAVVVQAMRDLARRRGLRSLVAPVRPTHKSLHPETSMEEYIARTRADGMPYDPWIRIHLRLGAHFRRVVPASLMVEATVREWEEWTGLRFARTGAFAVPGALRLVSIDREANRGRYEEPNVWMDHPMDETGTPRDESSIREDRMVR